MLLDPPSDLRVILRPRLLSVGSGDSLQELDVRQLETGALASVTDATLTTGQSMYWLDRSATDAPSAPTVIAANGGGRWFAFVSGSGSGDVATVNIIGRLPGAGLRAVVGTVGQTVIVRGYDAPGDDGGGTFVWVTTSAPNNDGTVIVPAVAFGANTAGAHWKRVVTGPLNVRYFGAHGDYDPNTNTGGTFDDAGFVRAMAALSLSPATSSRYTLLIPDGIYRITTTIVVRSNYALLGVGRPILWGIGVASVLQLGIKTPVPDLIANSDVLDLTVLGGSGGGVAAVDAYATQSCRVRVYVGGSYTYGVISEIVANAGGIAYNSQFEVYRFSYINTVNPFPVPAIPPNLVRIRGAWTNTRLHVEAYQNVGIGVYYEQVNPAGLGTLFLSGMFQGCGTAVQFVGDSTSVIRDVYCEGNTLDIIANGSSGLLIEKAVGRVRLRNCRGVDVDSTLRLDADKSNVGVHVRTSLATDVAPSASILTDQIGIIGHHVASEVARNGVWVSGLVPANDTNLFVNGDMRRWKTSGTTLLWGVSPWSSATTVKCGAGLADTVASSGSPFSARCSPTVGVGGGLPIKLCGPLGAAYEGSTITVSFKVRIATAGVGALAQLSDLTTVDWDISLPVVTVVSATGPSPEAIPVENSFVLYHYSFTVTPEVAANGAQLVFLIYDTTEFYLSELQATIGPSAPHHFLGRGRAFNGSVQQLGSGALETYGTAPPVGANEPYWNEPWLPGDVCLNTETSPGEPVFWVCQASGATPVWSPVYALDQQPVSTALTVYPLTNADYGRTLVFTSGSAISVTVPNGLQTGFSCTLIQQGTGQITVSGAATVNGRNGLKSAGQYAAVGIQNVALNSYVVGGDTVP